MPTETPLVSIIIPAYNAAAHIERCLSSVSGQSYTNTEIIVIDDGSTDATGSIVESCADRDIRIKCFHVQNGGEANSRNLGIANAHGSYLAFSDADDVMHPDMIEKMMDAILNDGTDMAVCRWNNVDEAGNPLPWSTSKLKSGTLSRKDAQLQFLTTLNIEGFCWNKLFSRELFERTGAQYDTDRLSYCDMFANYSLISAADKISCIGEPLYDYYQISTACTHTLNIRKNHDYLYVLSELQDEAETQGLSRSAHIFTVTRATLHLYAMYKNRAAYEPLDYREHFTVMYERFLKNHFLRNLYFNVAHSLNTPPKSAAKLLAVTAEYKRISAI